MVYFTASYAHTHGGMYAVYVGLFLIASLLLARMVYYFMLKVSEIEGMYSCVSYRDSYHMVLNFLACELIFKHLDVSF